MERGLGSEAKPRSWSEQSWSRGDPTGLSQASAKPKKDRGHVKNPLRRSSLKGGPQRHVACVKPSAMAGKEVEREGVSA
jgi:hypothetical protein